MRPSGVRGRGGIPSPLSLKYGINIKTHGEMTPGDDQLPVGLIAQLDGRLHQYHRDQEFKSHSSLFSFFFRFFFFWL